MAFLAGQALLSAPPWPVDEVVVWQSVLRPDGSRYAPLARFSLRTGELPLDPRRGAA